MIEWVLDVHYAHMFHCAPQMEQSIIVYGAMEAALTPLMQQIESEHPEIKVFSLPSVDHPQHGRHIELGIKGPLEKIPVAWAGLKKELHKLGASCGPELVRKL